MILQISLDKVHPINIEFLDELSEAKIAVKRDNGWVFKTSINVVDNGHPSIRLLNGLLTNAMVRNYHTLMFVQ